MIDGEPPLPPPLPDDRAWSRQVHAEALRRKGATGPCEACGSDAWSADPTVFLLHALTPSGTLSAGLGVELVAVQCRNCGLVRLHAGSRLLGD